MRLSAIPYPAVDPGLIELGPFVIRWYALAYIAGLVIGWRWCLMLAKPPPLFVTPEAIDDFLVWATLVVVLCGPPPYLHFYHPYSHLSPPHTPPHSHPHITSCT